MNRIDSSDLIDWIQQHPAFYISIAGFCLWVSLIFIIRIWLVHRNAPLVQKLFWTFVVLIPLFGWLCYGALFRSLPPGNVPCPVGDTYDPPYYDH